MRKKIDIKRKQIMENVEKEILNRMDMSSKNTCFITLKDHKENFLKKKFTLAYPKQRLKFAMATTKNCLQNNIIKTIRSYL